MTLKRKLTAAELGIHEVLGCDPLHDITDVVQYVISELANHVDDKSTEWL